MAHESIVKIYANVPFDARYEHSIYWQAHQRQLQYFGHATSDGVVADVIATLTDFSYLRKDNAVKVPIGYDSLANRGANYIAMYNGATGSAAGGWHYYFITSMEYLSDNCTRINVELDVLQTYQFMWDIPACFVEREHVPVSDDVAGKHLVPEYVELGEIVAHNSKEAIELDELVIVVQANVEVSGFRPDAEGNPIEVGRKLGRGDFIDNLFSGYYLTGYSMTDTGVWQLNSSLQELDADGKTDGVLSMWAYPKILVDHETYEITNSDGGTNPIGLDQGVRITGTKRLQWPGLYSDKIGSYTPRNKKLLTYPYNYLYVYNNMGTGAVYRYELFEGEPMFRLGGNLANDGSVRLVPQNYRGYAEDTESGLTLSGFPTLAWSQDMYKIWMAQTSSTQDLSIAGGLVTAGVGLVTAAASAYTGNAMGVMGGVGGMYSGFQQISGVMAQREDKKTQPPQAKGVQSSNSNVTMGCHHFKMAQHGVTEDYAARIDQYFDMFGYQVNTVKTPNITSRIMWNYIKTVGCVVTGAFPANDRRKIAAIFDKGVTFWKSPEVMYHYEYADANR